MTEPALRLLRPQRPGMPDAVWHMALLPFTKIRQVL